MLIRIVDDDEDLLESLEFFLGAEGWDVVCYTNADSFLKNDSPSEEGCVILDIRMEGMNGLQLQEEMNRREYKLPIVFLTGHGDVDLAVEAMKHGAKDFLQKPVEAKKLIQVISTIATEIKEKKDFGESLEYWKEKLQLLTDREKKVISMVALGLLNQDIAERLGISTRTVHTHRLNSYKKLGVHSLKDLAPIATLIKKENL